VRRHSPPFDVLAELPALRRYARSLARESGEADDLVQEVLLRACEQRHGFRPDGSLRGWLFAMLHNVFVSAWRSRTAARRREIRVAEATGDRSAPNQEGAVRLQQLWSAFLALPAEQRAAFHLVAIEGFSYAETAAALGVPVGTVMSRLARARAALRAFEAEPPRAAAPAPATRPPGLRIVGGRDG
jgi:RNA polymerase sigma-70 factor (ECF subfamily)